MARKKKPEIILRITPEVKHKADEQAALMLRIIEYERAGVSHMSTGRELARLRMRLIDETDPKAIKNLGQEMGSLEKKMRSSLTDLIKKSKEIRTLYREFLRGENVYRLQKFGSHIRRKPDIIFQELELKPSVKELSEPDIILPPEIEFGRKKGIPIAFIDDRRKADELKELPPEMKKVKNQTLGLMQEMFLVDTISFKLAEEEGNWVQQLDKILQEKISIKYDQLLRLPRQERNEVFKKLEKESPQGMRLLDELNSISDEIKRLDKEHLRLSSKLDSLKEKGKKMGEKFKRERGETIMKEEVEGRNRKMVNNMTDHLDAMLRRKQGKTVYADFVTGATHVSPKEAKSIQNLLKEHYGNRIKINIQDSALIRKTVAVGDVLSPLRIASAKIKESGTRAQKLKEAREAREAKAKAKQKPFRIQKRPKRKP